MVSEFAERDRLAATTRRIEFLTLAEQERHRPIRTVRGVTIQGAWARRLATAFARLTARAGQTPTPAAGQTPVDLAAFRLTRLPDRL